MFTTISWPLLGATVLGLAVTVSNAQDAASGWCDSITDICFQRFYDEELDMGWGYLFPPASDTSGEFVGLFTAPVSAGWVGNSLGGGMRSNPLVIGWVDNNHTALVTIRRTERMDSPGRLEGPQITLLGTSGANGTHQRIVYRCQNCTVWTGGSGGITTQLGYAAHGSTKPTDVTNANSTVPQHSVAGQHAFDVSAARSDSYGTSLEQLVVAPALRPPLEDAATPTATSAATSSSGNPVACANAPNPSFAMKTGKGWAVTAVLGSLTTPRGITLDSQGSLLVIERGKGLTGHRLDSDGCVLSSRVIIEDENLNHGLDVNGNRLVASSSDIAWSWDYDPNAMTASNRRTLVTGMDNPGHNTRTLHISRQNANYLIVSVGSNGNIDQDSIRTDSGTAQIRVFDMSSLPADGAAFTDETYGRVMGYGLRNDVGITEDRAGIIHSIENSMDNAYRIVNGERRDIHTDNPAEKMYNLGSPASPRSLFGGYPVCYTVWEPRDFSNGDTKKQAGDWFVQDPSNSTYNDAWCDTYAGKPTVLLPPHTAPLDLKFGERSGDNNVYASLHGSWNRDPPQGYKVIALQGQYSSSGEWSPSSSLADTKKGWTDILVNSNGENSCRSGCFRPVGLAFGNGGNHLYVSSDTSGEVFLLRPGNDGVRSSSNRPAFSTILVVTIIVGLVGLVW